MQRSLILTRDGIYSIDIINYNANNHKNIQYGTDIKGQSINTQHRVTTV